MVSQISHETFTQYLSEPFKKTFKHIRDNGRYGSFFVCGDATRNIKVMCETNTDCISIDENINIVEAKKITDSYNIIISGNIPLTSILLLGNQKDNQKFALDLTDQLGKENFILAPGCDMPYETPKENLIGIAQALQDPHSVKHFLANYQREAASVKVELPDYTNLVTPLIEVFTVDSASCAACGYMKVAAEEMLTEFPNQIEVIEYKITEPENIYRVEQLGVKNLPSILINGEVKFASIIPTRKELREEIKKYLK
jgi:uroporphyrinogen decarboxylase